VEKILDKSKEKCWNEKRKKHEFYYEVKWVGWDEPNWEPESNLNCPFMINTYELQQKVRKYKVAHDFNVENVLQKYNLMPNSYEPPISTSSNNGTIFLKIFLLYLTTAVEFTKILIKKQIINNTSAVVFCFCFAKNLSKTIF
jgi:hypothetical protein